MVSFPSFASAISAGCMVLSCPTASRAEDIVKYRGSDFGNAIASMSVNSELLFRLCIRNVEKTEYGEIVSPVILMTSSWAIGEDYAEPPPSQLSTKHTSNGKWDVAYGKYKSFGSVEIRRMKPGPYEVYRVVSGEYSCDPRQNYINSKGTYFPDFSIPFYIAPGKSVYIGEFSNLIVVGKSAILLGAKVSAGHRFVLSDRSSRDLPIARAKSPDLGEIEIAVPDGDALGTDLVSATP